MLKGEITVLGDKSLSHRALILGSLAQGETIIKGFLASQDCLATLTLLQKCGVRIEQSKEEVRVQGQGLTSLQAASEPLMCHNSGTSMRLLAGVFAAQPFSTVLQGDVSLNRRPMSRLVLPLRKMGAQIDGVHLENEIFPPLAIQGNPALQGIHYAMPLASAQVKSCLLLAGLFASTSTVLVENTPTRDHTERMLKDFGANIKVEYRKIILTPSSILQAQEIVIPGDLSSAAFFITAAAMTPNSHLFVKNVGINPTRTGFISILRQMGANIIIHPKVNLGSEPCADIEVKGARLQGISIGQEWISLTIDEFPILFIAAACATGQTILRGAQELRFKETDRIQAMALGLSTLGISVAALRDGIIIQGGTLQGGAVDCFGDHRVAMAFAMAGLVAKNKVIISNAANIVTSFPNFKEVANQLGVPLYLED